MIETFEERYKADLKMRITRAVERDQKQSRAIVLFHGGGLVAGSPSWFDQHARHLCSAGLICYAPQYRTKNSSQASVQDAMDDASDAIEWVLNKGHRSIVILGASAGALLAFHAGLNKPCLGFVFLNPVIDTCESGFKNKQINNMINISPIHILPGLVSLAPSLIIQCIDDDVVPVESAIKFSKLWPGACSLILNELGGHGFFNRPPFLQETTEHIAQFCLDLDTFGRKEPVISTQSFVKDKPMDSDLRSEADYFSKANNAKTRSNAWGAISYFGRRLNDKINLMNIVVSDLKARDIAHPIALTLCCGDMTGEYNFFKRIGVNHIDAFDISEGQKTKFLNQVYDNKIEVNYSICDVNKIKLPPTQYDVVYMQQSLHHIVDVEHVCEQIRYSLKPGGMFVLNDYIGEPFLQRSQKQREIARRIWKALPARLRTDPNGAIMPDIHIPRKAALSPFEAVRSDAIVPALREHFDTTSEFVFGGVVFPVINGFAAQYDETRSDDLTIVALLWEMDELLTASQAVDPCFIRGVYRPKISDNVRVSH